VINAQAMNPKASKAPAVQEPTEELSRNEAAYKALKEALVTLLYKPGEYLNTAQVMDRFGLGRTPVNQALHRLSAEGLVQIIPRKGAMAAPLSINDALEPRTRQRICAPSQRNSNAPQTPETPLR